MSTETKILRRINQFEAAELEAAINRHREQADVDLGPTRALFRSSPFNIAVLTPPTGGLTLVLWVKRQGRWGAVFAFELEEKAIEHLEEILALLRSESETPS